MNHEMRVTIINALKDDIFLKNFVGESEEEVNDVIVFLLAFIVLLKKNELQIVPFQFELILSQPLLSKFDKNDWEGMLFNAVDMDKTDKVEVEIDEEAIAFGQHLTPTELVIALLICNELTDEMVAGHSGKTLNCVRKHHTNINTKLGAKCSLGIYKRMLAFGLVNPPKREIY